MKNRLHASDYLQLSRMAAARHHSSAPDGHGTRQRLLEAARVEFSERGIGAATTRKIAQRAGCNEVTLFRHFETKQKLLAAVVQETSEELRAICECRETASGNLAEDLAWFAQIYNDSLERCEGMARAMIGEGLRRPNLAKELIADTLEPFHRRVADYLKHLQAQGRVRHDFDPLTFAEVMTATLLGGLLRRSSGLSALDRDTWIRESIAIFTAGIRPQR